MVVWLPFHIVFPRRAPKPEPNRPESVADPNISLDTNLPTQQPRESSQDLQIDSPEQDHGQDCEEIAMSTGQRNTESVDESDGADEQETNF